MSKKNPGRTIIKGKLYDISTAREVFRLDSETPDGRKTKIRQSLYRKNGGEFFLYTTIIYMDDLEEAPTEFFRLLDEATARKWVKDNATQEEYDNFDYLVDKNRTKVNFSISGRIMLKIRKEAAIAGVSVSQYIERILTDAFDDLVYDDEKEKS